MFIPCAHPRAPQRAGPVSGARCCRSRLNARPLPTSQHPSNAPIRARVCSCFGAFAWFGLQVEVNHTLCYIWLHLHLFLALLVLVGVDCGGLCTSMLPAVLQLMEALCLVQVHGWSIYCCPSLCALFSALLPFSCCVVLQEAQVSGDSEWVSPLLPLLREGDKHGSRPVGPEVCLSWLVPAPGSEDAVPLSRTLPVSCMQRAVLLYKSGRAVGL